MLEGLVDFESEHPVTFLRDLQDFEWLKDNRPGCDVITNDEVFGRDAPA